MPVVLTAFRPFLIVATVVLNGMVFFGGQVAQAQSARQNALVIPKLDGSLELDGRIEETAWRGARVLRLVQSKPDFGEDASQETEVLVGYTDEYLYAGDALKKRLTAS